MFELYGWQYRDYDDYDVRILIATFDTKEAAWQYVQDSFVSPPSSPMRSSPRPFHSASVLGAYTDYEVVAGEGISHNPVRNW